MRTKKHEQCLRALKVLAWSRRTREWLQANDPMALKQADEAIGDHHVRELLEAHDRMRELTEADD
jgi:hypothetical protein